MAMYSVDNPFYREEISITLKTIKLTFSKHKEISTIDVNSRIHHIVVFFQFGALNERNWILRTEYMLLFSFWFTQNSPVFEQLFF